MKKNPQTPTIEQLLAPELIERLRAWLRSKNYPEFEMVSMIKNHPEPYLVLILNFLNKEATEWGTLHRTTAEQLGQAQLSLAEILRIHTILYQHYIVPNPHKPPSKILWFSLGLMVGIIIVSLTIFVLPSKLGLFE